MKTGKNLKRVYSQKGGIFMKAMVKENEPEKLNLMDNIRKLAQEAIQKKGLTEEQIIKSLGIRRYGK